MLDEVNFSTLPLKESTIKYANKLQVYLQQSQYSSSPADLYLASSILMSGSKDFFLITENVSDFPYPVFKRSGHIILNSPNHTAVLSILEKDEKAALEVNKIIT